MQSQQRASLCTQELRGFQDRKQAYDAGMDKLMRSELGTADELFQRATYLQVTTVASPAEYSTTRCFAMMTLLMLSKAVTIHGNVVSS